MSKEDNLETQNLYLDDILEKKEQSKSIMISKSISNPEKVDFYRDAPYYYSWFFGYYDVGHLIDFSTNKKLDKEKFRLTKKKLFWIVWNDENIMEVYKEHKKMLIQEYIQHQED